MKFTPIIAAIYLLASPAFGHHSDAALRMDEVVTFQGVVSEYRFRNPHAYFTVEAAGEDGAPVEWSVQMASSITMTRLGWGRETLAVGDQVTVGVNPARDGRTYGLIYSIEKVGGPTIIARPDEMRRSTTEQVRASTVEGRWMVDRSRLPEDYPGGLDQLTIRDLTLTEKGRTAEAAYSQASEDNPELSCISKPTPSLIIYTDLYPMEILLNGSNEGEDIITIRSQYFDTVRAIYMDGREHPPASEQFHEGHSVGRWEDDVLVIDTTNFDYHRSPYQNGVPSGAQKHVIERYRLIDDGSHMNVEFFLEDPEYIDGSMTYDRDLRYTPQSDMSPFNCDLEATSRFVPE
ncbi:MAG: hypothetical protein HOM55_03155 [Proteobacteria bacterium]|jgi:hypothetical protein|nr:hypothetical protein [Pseudomonadota bacterium]